MMVDPSNGRNIPQQTYQDVLLKAFLAQYENGSDEWTNDREMRSIPSIVQGRLKLPRSASVLDIGCGAGFDLEYFSSLFRSVVGIDLCQHSMWSTLTRERKNIQIYQGDFLVQEFQERFDLVVDNGCFHHQDPGLYGAYLDKVRSVMNEGGCLVLSTFSNGRDHANVDDLGRIHRYFSNSELHSCLRNGGFDVVYEMDLHRRYMKDFYRVSFCTDFRRK